MMKMQLKETSLEIAYIEEPLLEFGHSQKIEHPKDGLFLYGPQLRTRKAKDVCIGVVGTKDGLEHHRIWAQTLLGLIEVPPPSQREKKNRLHLSNFPGLEEAFGITIDPQNFVEKAINPKTLDEATRTLNIHEAVSKAVDLYIEKIEYHDKNEEEKVDIWIFVLPELVFERCKPLAKRTGLPLVTGDFIKQQKKKVDLPLLEEVIDQEGEGIFNDVPDFHRQAKAKLLKLGYTSQLIRETTVARDKFLNKAGHPIRQLQDPASVAWNFTTGLYYKTQANPPWKIANIRPGVCYVGLVYKIIPNHPQSHACCAAQMFLSEGDGVVFRGANGPWKTSKFEFHLKKKAAENLISTVVETYKDKHGEAPQELFIHGRTNFNNEEWDAFTSSVPEETNVIGVRIKETRGESKLFRDGDYPTLRGTAMILDDRNAYLWTTGFIPYLDTYIGPETPNPLLITILRSTKEMPKIKDVLGDIMGLTKINYNACNYSDGLPVTVRFADKVGDILIMGSAQGAEKQPFKFYV